MALDAAAVAQVFEGAEVTAEMVQLLKPESDVPGVLAEIEAIKTS